MIRRVLVLSLLLAAIADGGAIAFGDDAANKLGRGIQNVTFGWFEIVNEIGNESDRRGPLIGFISGLVRGAGLGLIRTTAGIFETLTFPLPNGEKGYGSIVIPETVFHRR